MATANIDWRNPDLRLGVALGLLQGLDHSEFSNNEYCDVLNHYIVYNQDIKLTFEILKEAWKYYTRDNVMIINHWWKGAGKDKYLDCGNGYGCWTINDKGICVEYEDDGEEFEEEYPVDMTEDDKHIVSISAEEQEENDKTANQYDDPIDYCCQRCDLEFEEGSKFYEEAFITEDEVYCGDCKKWFDEQDELSDAEEEKPKKKPLMLAEPDDDETFRSLCMDANEVNGYGRIC